MITSPLLAGLQAYIAQPPIELIQWLPAVQYVSGPDRHFRRIAHVKVPDVRPGDLLLCNGSFEITNGLQYLVELAAALVLTPCAQGTAGVELMPSLSSGQEPPDGRFVTGFSGFNVTPNQCQQFPYGGMHHAIFPMGTSYVVPAGVSGDQYLAVIAYCGGLQAWPTTAAVKVEPLCGRLSVLRAARQP